MSATVQLNARMSRSLKEAGDEALALIGFSPTQAVRALWEKAARRGKDLENVAALLRDDKGARQDRAADNPVAASWTLVEDTMASYGLSYSRPADMPDDDALLEEALYERLAERGLA